MYGVEKKIDSLGRVVIPIEYGRILGLEYNSSVLLLIENERIIIKSRESICALCGRQIEKEYKFRLCTECLTKVRSEGV